MRGFPKSTDFLRQAVSPHTPNHERKRNPWMQSWGLGGALEGPTMHKNRGEKPKGYQRKTEICTIVVICHSQVTSSQTPGDISCRRPELQSSKCKGRLRWSLAWSHTPTRGVSGTFLPSVFTLKAGTSQQVFQTSQLWHAHSGKEGLQRR